MATVVLELFHQLRSARLNDVSDRALQSPGQSLYSWQEDDSDLHWKNTDLASFLNWAILEAGKRNPIHDEVTASICQIALVAGVSTYALDSRIMTVEEVRLQSTGKPLMKITRERKEMEVRAGDRFSGIDWRAQAIRVDSYIEDMGKNSLRVIDTPTSADTLLLSVQRRYLDVIVWEDLVRDVGDITFSELPDELAEALLAGAASRAFLKADPDIYNPQMARDAEQEFNQWVGPPVDWRTLESRRLNANLAIEVTPYPYSPRIERRRSYSGRNRFWDR